MKLPIELQRNPAARPAFSRVAEMIARSPPPEWLITGLEHFSDFVAAEQTSRDDAKEYGRQLWRMHDAADVLIKWLPLFGHLPAGHAFPDDVLIALDVLPRIRGSLARALAAEGSWADEHRKTCAAVVVEAWQLCRRKTEPSSERLWEACNEYWQACGREYRIAESWKRDAIEAAGRERGWIRHAFLLAGYKPR
jgi:hypothetical protein